MLDEWDAALTRNQPGIDHQLILAELETGSEVMLQRIEQILLKHLGVSRKARD
jgi:hypothetical protein